MFVHKKSLGSQVFWRFPIYRKPLEMGEQKVISTNQLQVNKIYDMIQFYKKLQDRIDEFNDLIATEEDIPLSLNKERKKKIKKSPPMLSLRPKYIIETSLPLFDDQNVLTVASTEQEIILQKPKYLGKVMCLITITLHRSLECWVWTIYCPQNNRTFAINFYSSDLFKLPEKLFSDESFDGDGADKKLWGILIDLCYIDHNSSGDVIFTLSNFKSPLKEIMYQNYLYSEQGEDIYFMEITMKTTQNYVTQIESAFPPLDMNQIKDFVINLRAYSITRNIWIKDYQPLRTLVNSLQKEKYFTKNTLLVYYNMIRDACVLLAYRVRFSDNAKTREVKKQKIELDITKLLGPKKHIPLSDQKLLKQDEEEIEVDLVKFNKEKERRDKKKQEDDPYGKTLLPGEERVGLKDGVSREVDLSRILYQMVISLSPMQTATVLYNDIIDTFTYRIYRPQDGSVYEKIYTGEHIKIHCHPVYKSCIEQGKQQEVGQRILGHYMDEVLIESTLEFNDIL